MILQKSNSNWLALIFILFAWPTAAHEEMCTFTAVLSDVQKVDDKPRDSKEKSSNIIANVKILNAKSRTGTLSYLDCKHWENETFDNVEMVVQEGGQRQLADQSIQIDFTRRQIGSDSKSMWRIRN